MRRLAVLLSVLTAFLVCVAPASAWTWPVEGPLLQEFSFGGDPYAAGQHRGIDIGAEAGETVRAPATGMVTFAGTVPTAGRTITITTEDGYAVTLLHLGSLTAKTGAPVSEGAPVALAGRSGVPEHDAIYVHLGIRAVSEPDGYVDPMKLLPGVRESSAGPPAPASQERDGSASPAGAAPADAAGSEPVGQAAEVPAEAPELTTSGADAPALAPATSVVPDPVSAQAATGAAVPPPPGLAGANGVGSVSAVPAPVLPVAAGAREPTAGPREPSQEGKPGVRIGGGRVREATPFRHRMRSHRRVAARRMAGPGADLAAMTALASGGRAAGRDGTPAGPAGEASGIDRATSSLSASPGHRSAKRWLDGAAVLVLLGIVVLIGRRPRPDEQRTPGDRPATTPGPGVATAAEPPENQHLAEARPEPVPIIAAYGDNAERWTWPQDSGCRGVAVRERPPPHRPRGRLRRAVGHLCSLSPARRQRRAHGERNGRAWHADHGRGRQGRSLAARAGRSLQRGDPE